MSNKCEDSGFKHLWEDTTPNIVYTSNPPSFPPKQRTCENCGIKEVLKLKQREIREWERQ